MIVQCTLEGQLTGLDIDAAEARVDTITQALTDRGLDNLAVSATLSTGAVEVEFTLTTESLREGQVEAWRIFVSAIN